MSEMSIHLRSSSSPAAAPPLEDENLLSEILLRLPPDPSSLPRAAAVCKRWRHLVSDARFTRHFRIHHRRNPPLLGFFHTYAGISFQPTLDTPNRVAPGRFSLQQNRGDALRFLGCRHGLVLILDTKQKQALVWDPFTRVQHRIALPPRFNAKDRLTKGAVLRAAGDIHFQVVLVFDEPEYDKLQTRMFACVYSSETGLWGNLISTLLPFTVFPAGDVGSEMPAVLVGDSLYWTHFGEFRGIIEFDLERQSITGIRFPINPEFEEEHDSVVIPAECGGIVLLLVSEEDLNAQFWKRKTDCDGVNSWELGRTIELDKLLSLNSVEERYCCMMGFAEYNNEVFLWTGVGLFLLELESLQVKKVCENDDELRWCYPFESVYAAGNWHDEGTVDC